MDRSKRAVLPFLLSIAVLLAPVALAASLHVETDKTIYCPGDMVRIRVQLTGATGDATVSLAVYDPSGSLVYADQVTISGGEGEAVRGFQLGRDASEGEWRVVAQYSSTRAATSFVVTRSCGGGSPGGGGGGGLDVSVPELRVIDISVNISKPDYAAIMKELNVSFPNIYLPIEDYNVSVEEEERGLIRSILSLVTNGTLPQPGLTSPEGVAVSAALGGLVLVLISSMGPGVGLVVSGVVLLVYGILSGSSYLYLVGGVAITSGMLLRLVFGK